MRTTWAVWLLAGLACVSRSPAGPDEGCTGVPAALRQAAPPGGRLVAGSTCLAESLRIEGTAAAALHLPRLTEVDGDLIVRGAPGLQSVDLPALRRVTGSVIVVASPGLEQLVLPRLAEVGGDLIIGAADPAAASDRPDARGTRLPELTLPALRAVGNELRIRGNRGLASVALPALQVVRGPTTIAANPMLVAVRVAATARLYGLTIAHNRALASLRGLAGRQRVDGDLVLRDLPLLSDLRGLDALSEVDGLLLVSENPALRSVELPRLTRLGDGLRLNNNAGLVEVRLAAPGGVEAAVEISHNPALTRITWDGTRRFGGRFDVTANPRLEMVALPAAEAIDGDLGLVDLAQLTEIRAAALARVGQDLVVRGADRLRALPLPALRVVHGHLILQGNAALASVAGLSGVRTVGEQVYVHDNPALPACAGAQLTAQLTRPPRRPTDAASNGRRCP